VEYTGAFWRGGECLSPRDADPKVHEARKSAVGAVKAAADRYAANVLPIIREAQKAGARTLREIAEALNARGIATARDGQRYAQSVADILCASSATNWRRTGP
jgi:hypothetical protein